jgi:dTDP-4-amino-4,6-dideoxygalactose transaminase
MPVHYGGQPCRMDEIAAICRPGGIRIIEDAAHAAGSRYRDRPVGSLGDATVFSFYPVKNMTTAQGGMLTTDDAALAEQARILRNHGMDTNAWNRYTAGGTPFYTVTAPGFNYGMTDLQAALGLVQLKRLPEFNHRRAHLAGMYTRLLERLPEIETPRVRSEVTSNWHLYVVRLRDLDVGRDTVIEGLRERGIGTAVHFLPIHYHPYYRERFGFCRGDYPVAEREFERLISLPLFPGMAESDVERVVRALEAVLHRSGPGG